MARILIVDDIKQHQETLATPFRSTHDVNCVNTLRDVDRLLAKWWPDVALVDAIFPKTASDLPSFQAGSFLDLIEEKSNSARRPQIIILSGQSKSVEKFVSFLQACMKPGKVCC